MNSRVQVWPASTPSPTAMAVVAMVAATLACATPAMAAQVRANAQAEQSRSLGDRLLRRNLPPSGRYVAESGESFIFDRSGARPLFRFASRAETWVLRQTPAPRGDIIYRNDNGDQILRVTPEGGMTLYSVRAPNGSPASMTGPAPNLAVPTLGPVRLFNLMAQHSAVMSRALGRLIQFDVITGSRSEVLTVEALTVVTDAVVRMARSEPSRSELNNLRRIQIREGSRASATYVNGTLRIVVAPDQGVSGRPSSARVIRAFNGPN